MSAARHSLCSSAAALMWFVACNPWPPSPSCVAVAGTDLGQLGLMVLTKIIFKVMMEYAEFQELLRAAHREAAILLKLSLPLD